MRILILFLAAFLTSTNLYGELSNQKFRENLKNSLYSCQIGIMDWEKYNQFIEPYIQEAESTLEVSNYVKMNPDNQATYSYLNSLLNYNIAVFHNTAATNSQTRKLLKKNYKNLLQSIAKIKQKSCLNELSPEDEAQKTADLLHRANLAYYQKIEIKIKLKYRFYRCLQAFNDYWFRLLCF